MDRRQNLGEQIRSEEGTSQPHSVPVLGSHSEKVVTVLCDLTYEVSETERHTIKAEERLLLLDQTNEDWWMVARADVEHQGTSEETSASSSNPLSSLPFFVPTSYVRLLPQQKEASPGTTTEDCDDLRCKC